MMFINSSPGRPRSAGHSHSSRTRTIAGEEQPVAEGASAAAQHGRSSHAQPKHEEEREQQEGQGSAGELTKPNPTQPEASPSAASRDEHSQEGPLSLLPGDVLDHVVSLLAAEEGGSCIRSTCTWLRSAFDRCNTRLVLRGTAEQLPLSFPARLLDLVRYSPCVSSLALAEGMECVTWPQVLEAGGPQLLQRLERLTLMHRAPALNLEALAACTRLQRLCLRDLPFEIQHVGLDGFQPGHQAALQLQPLAACGGTLRHLQIHDCSVERDITPLAACVALQHLSLHQCLEVKDIAPPAACIQLQTLHLDWCPHLRDLAPLSACVALRELRLKGCRQIFNLSPLASCAGLQHLALMYCRIEDLAPLAACVALRTLDLTSCSGVRDLGPLAACVRLQALVLEYCSNVQSLSPLASCLGLESLDLRGCGAPGRSSLAALSHLHIIE